MFVAGLLWLQPSSSQTPVVMGPRVRGDDEELRRLPHRGATPQESAELSSLALARNEIDVADEFCAALAPLQHDLAAVKGLQLRPMRDADDGGFRQFRGHHLHHLV